jgi:hypothetical protein
VFKFPSIPAAILTGALWMPLFFWSVRLMERNVGNQLLLFLWSLIGFVLPVLVSTGDLRYIRDRMQAERSLFGKLRIAWASPEDYKLFYVPAWTRIGVLLLSTVISLMSLKLIGINP